VIGILFLLMLRDSVEFSHTNKTRNQAMHTQTVINAARNVTQWGRFAAKRNIIKRTGWNEATALRCLTIALQCEAVK